MSVVTLVAESVERRLRAPRLRRATPPQRRLMELPATA
jgi:hypothetical protein